MNIALYVVIIQDYIDNKVSTAVFERQFMKMYLSDPTIPGPYLFKILDGFFSDVDSYDPDCTPEEENQFRISESTLRRQAQKTLDALRDYQSKNNAL